MELTRKQVRQDKANETMEVSRESLRDSKDSVISSLVSLGHSVVMSLVALAAILAFALRELVDLAGKMIAFLGKHALNAGKAMEWHGSDEK